MRMVQQLNLTTKEARFLFNIKVDKEYTLINAIKFKIMLLYKLAEQQNIYAYIYLLQMQINMNAVLDELKQTIQENRKLLKKHLESYQDLTMPVLKEKQVQLHNQLHFTLLQIIQKFDECIADLNLMRNAQLFTHANNFYNARKKTHKQVLRLLYKTLNVKVRGLPKVNFYHYLNQEIPYLEAAKTFGAINPEMLYNAIHSTATPTLHPQDLNRITTELRKMGNVKR